MQHVGSFGRASVSIIQAEHRMGYCPAGGQVEPEVSALCLTCTLTCCICAAQHGHGSGTFVSCCFHGVSLSSCGSNMMEPHIQALFWGWQEVLYVCLVRQGVDLL